MNSVIAEALSITPQSDAQDWSFARQWCVTAIEQLGTSEDEIKVAQILNQQLVIPKPDDMRQFIELSLFDGAGNYYPHNFRAGRKRIYPDVRHLGSAVLTPTQNFAQINGSNQLFVPIDVSEDQLNFYLGTNGTMISYAYVRYFAYPVDANGLPMIRLDEKFAVMAYIKYCKASRTGTNQSEIAMLYQTWQVQCDRARAHKKASSLSNDKMVGIARNWVTFIPNFNYRKY
jgi:hypothetical protein